MEIQKQLHPSHQCL